MSARPLVAALAALRYNRVIANCLQRDLKAMEGKGLVKVEGATHQVLYRWLSPERVCDIFAT